MGIFLVGAILIVELLSLGSRQSGFFESYIAGAEIYKSIRKSKSKSKSKKVLLGDSVAKQLFDNEGNPYIQSLACNRAISLAGHYILLQNYLRAGNRPDSVYLMCTPFSFQNNLDEIYTFHYFLKPFYKTEYQEFLNETVRAQAAKIPSRFLLNSQYILATDWAPPYESSDKKVETFLSPISLEYLSKMSDLSQKYNFEFSLIPAPIRADRLSKVDDLEKNISGHPLEEKLLSFYNNIWTINENKFVDKEHLKKDILNFYSKKAFDKLLVISKK